MHPRLSKAIMSVCWALFIESLSMFSHETPDPSNQSPLSWALETCFYHNFQPRSRRWHTASGVLKWGGRKCKFLKRRMWPRNLRLFVSSGFHDILCPSLSSNTPFSPWRSPSLRHLSFAVTNWDRSTRSGGLCVCVSAADWLSNTCFFWVFFFPSDPNCAE